MRWRVFMYDGELLIPLQDAEQLCCINNERIWVVGTEGGDTKLMCPLSKIQWPYPLTTVISTILNSSVCYTNVEKKPSFIGCISFKDRISIMINDIVISRDILGVARILYSLKNSL